ncbi:sterol desaturase family protein [Pseudodesulfovibrio cashew]|uniref:Sterol desaturase family protein n=1 Tax=Pseudodesulfovibrio cashew TaxID=2678688 RepID=A0A6I6JIU4_9BACT|nr:sterol desaturase family protein [Pseudodesulfovibrio cashew]QGY40990.1 sterol desaturase family protein [Pseudodesulfovibrio cashew]
MPYESSLRLGVFFLVLAIMAAAETLRPRKRLTAPRFRRWFSNLSVVLIATLLVRFLIPLVPTGLAVTLAERGWGLFNFLSLPQWLTFLPSVLLLDALIYGQHVLFHHQRLLWRIHRMHHADVDIDASTGIRFHPIEIFLSMLIKLAAIALLGPPPAAVLTFELVLNGCAMFNHANVKLPLGLDATLRLLVVTPDMHRVHHSTHPHEFNANFGFSFPWWDRLFGTYKAQPDEGHETMVIGLNILRDPKYLSLPNMLAIPFL